MNDIVEPTIEDSDQPPNSMELGQLQVCFHTASQMDITFSVVKTTELSPPPTPPLQYFTVFSAVFLGAVS